MTRRKSHTCLYIFSTDAGDFSGISDPSSVESADVETHIGKLIVHNFVFFEQAAGGPGQGQ
jgi:hypothetical protein